MLTNEGSWQDEFIRLADGANLILIVPSCHAGTQWELDTLFAQPAFLRKTIFIVPPNYSQWAPYLGHSTHISRFGLSGAESGAVIVPDALAAIAAMGIDLNGKEAKEGFLFDTNRNRRVTKLRPICGYNKQLFRIYDSAAFSIENLRRTLGGCISSVLALTS